MEKAEPLRVTINGQEMLAEVKQFSTGSFGWYLNGKTVIDKAKLPGVAREGPIALQAHGSPVQFGNIYIKELK